MNDPAREWHRAMPYTRITDYGMEPADARELLWRTANGEDWTSAATEIGRRQLARSDQAANRGRGVTARDAALAAAAALNVAQIPITFDEPQKRVLYEEFQSAVGRYAIHRGGLERLRIDYADGTLEGWLVLPDDTVTGTVVAWGGLSGWGAAYLSAAEALTARGLACILAEGPGQGSTRLTSRIYGAEATLTGYDRFVEFAATDRRLTDAPVGVYGNSFGGMIAARVAAGNKLVSACAINCAPSTLELPDIRTAREQIFAFVGTTDSSRANEALGRLAFLPDRHSMSAPLLLLHGVADALVTQDNASRFMAGSSHHDSSLLIWPDGEHTLYNHAQERDAVMADWFASRLGSGPPQ
ncbi:alpha/beta hydrolase [Kribbella caucasensis]|uniref:alpha/beta hydrolase n=1 Tax=Kribbella caucasensis TaxID=2512215 RepID=UPI001414CE6D|nr:alpha/beta fold hydrolase [Kribbella sp. VKM Ac-2527]